MLYETTAQLANYIATEESELLVQNYIVVRPTCFTKISLSKISLK